MKRTNADELFIDRKTERINYDAIVSTGKKRAKNVRHLRALSEHGKGNHRTSGCRYKAPQI